MIFILIKSFRHLGIRTCCMQILVCWVVSLLKGSGVDTTIVIWIHCYFHEKYFNIYSSGVEISKIIDVIESEII